MMEASGACGQIILGVGENRGIMRFDGSTRRRILLGLMLALGACWPGFFTRLSAAEERDVPAAVAEEVTRLIAELDHSQFATRDKAASRLEELSADEKLGPYLSKRFRRAVVSGETSFEVRSRLEPLLRLLPAATIEEPKPSEEQIVPLLDQLGSDSYADRDSAARRLRAMLAHVELIAPLWLELKRRAAEGARSASAKRSLEPLLERVREAWLLADPAKVPLPQPSDEEISRYIDELSRLDEFALADGARRDAVERELLDLIVRDDTRERVLGMLREKIAASGDAGRSPLHELLDFAQPTMAAEVWLNHNHMTVQYLIIGMPQYNDTLTGPRATLFDRIDEQTAHCVSGNSLTPGDYPVRVAIPHPEPTHETMFYLTNLPTPRRRLAYEYHLKRDQAVRLQDISDRTLDFFLRRRAPLAETEILLLAQLDARSVSRFVGPYFETVKNAGLVSTQNGLNNQSTVFAGICAVMSRVGTREAVPALERVAKSGELGKPTYESRLDVAWVAALAIAQRDPWSGIDEWLANLVDVQQPLTSDPDRPPEVGASAAGMLLDRHGASTRPFGLETAGESVTESFRFIGYRFSSDRDRQDVKRWWQKQQVLTEAARAAKLTGQEPAAPARIRIGAGPIAPKPAER
jgi:hypothetical protein